MKPGASLAFNLLTAAMGTGLLALLGAEHAPHQVRDLVATLTVFVIVVLIMNRQEELTLAVQRPGRWKLPRKTESIWSYEGPVGPIVIRDRLTIRRVGRLVLATGESYSVEGDAGFTHFRYRVRAALNPEGVLEGRWENRQDRNYYGFFQLLAQRDGSGYSGSWLGMNRQGAVRTGTWHWR
jgi:hypothetical protein